MRHVYFGAHRAYVCWNPEIEKRVCRGPDTMGLSEGEMRDMHDFRGLHVHFKAIFK